MTTASLVLQKRHLEAITALILRPDGTERAAYVLCGQSVISSDPWDRRAHIKLLSREVIAIPETEVLSASDSHVSWKTDSFVRALGRARAENLVVAVVHSHPGGSAKFSEQDDLNEPDLWQLAANRNGSGALIASLVINGVGGIAGRLWLGQKHPEPFRNILVAGEAFELHFDGRGAGTVPEDFQRQSLAFGAALGQDLAKLRIGVVGCGGTGSATAMLLARLGVGHLVLFDDDVVERTNLNRLHGAKRSDADAMAPKVDVVARSITELGLGCRVSKVKAWVGDPAGRDALKSCDVIFGCTDDHDGRALLNRFAYFYLTPIIDMGLWIEVSKETPPRLLVCDGRVTVLAPDHTCLLCRGTITSVAARDEALRRSNPAEYDRRKRSAYVADEGEPAPAVVTFTTEVAAMAVEELVGRLQGFRRPVANRVRKFQAMQDKRPGAAPQPHCKVCNDEAVWGRGDIEPFLDRVG